MQAPLRCCLAVLFLASLRLAHRNLLWSDEDYHLAAAIQILHGRVPYRDFWYDKPPLAALFYTSIGGFPGWPLRLLGIAFILACCWFTYKLATAWWTEHEGYVAALLLAFFTTFYLPAANIPLAVDGLMLLPHLAAVYFAHQRRPFLSGIACAVALLTNVKAVFVAATCALWLTSEIPLFAAGFAVPTFAALAAAASLGALSGYFNQVWQWGFVYAKGSTAPNAFWLAIKHCANWLAFHCALVAGAILAWLEAHRQTRWRLAVWFAFSSAALFFGNHFAPRYFLQLLPVMVIAAARGMVLSHQRLGRTALAVIALLLLLPLARFGPRYLTLLLHQDTNWTDTAMDRDSQRVAAIINRLKQPGDTLFVWGYRPDDYVYTRLLPPGTFWDSQPLDGVPADRHLASTEAIPTPATRQHRAELIQTTPTFIVDGLGLLNPALAPTRFPEVDSWLSHYRLVQATPLSRIYKKH